MLLYHVSADIDMQERLFTPRVPELSRKAKEIEDILIPRICFAESVSGCFSALPKYSRQKLAKPEARFVLYQIDADELPSDAFVSNREIVEKKLVYDANITKEWWILQEIFLKGKLCEVICAEQRELLDIPLIADVKAWNYFVKYRIIE